MFEIITVLYLTAYAPVIKKWSKTKNSYTEIQRKKLERKQKGKWCADTQNSRTSMSIVQMEKKNSCT